MKMTGAQAMVESLKAEGVSLLFGYPGAAICPFYESLADSGIRHILTRNEQNAGHAASGYARMTGKPAVCVATSGPGATNLFTAVATAYMDSIPLVIITGQVSTELLGRDVFQEVDTTGAVEPFTKYSYLVKDAAEIPRVFKEAFYIASTGRQGPVLIDMPVDVQRRIIDFQYPDAVEIRGYKPCYKGHTVQVRRVASAIASAQRPLFCVGGGVVCAGAQNDLRQLCEQCSIPTVSTLMGIGALPSAHPLYFGMVGQCGSDLANQAIAHSDLLVVIGARVGDRAVAAPYALEKEKTVVHIDIDSAEIGKNLSTTIPLVGNASMVLGQLMKQQPKGNRADWIAWLTAQHTPPPTVAVSNDYVEPNSFVRLLSAAMEKDAVYVADVGQNQIWSARNYIAQGGRFLTTGGMGTMGYALPAAIGAKLAEPHRQVVAVCGDGAFQMAMMELATLNQSGVSVKLVVMRNNCLGMVRQIQRGCVQPDFAVMLDGSPSIGGIAQAYGIPFASLSDMSCANQMIEQLLQAKGSYILECVVDGEEKTV